MGWFQFQEITATPVAVAVLGGGYFMTSLILFKYPYLIHRVKDVKFLARHISHRGGAAEYYENTMGAFRKAAKQGTEMLEIDCQLTKDGEVVILHDYNLKRLTGIDKTVSSVLYKDLPPLLEVLPVDFVPGKHFIWASTYESSRRIPKLEELFSEFQHMPVNVDVKSNNDDLIEKINQMIIKYNREEITVWGSFSATVGEKCFKQNSNINLFFSKKAVYLILLYYYTGLLPFVPIKETHLEICLPSIYLSWSELGPFKHAVMKFLNLVLIRKSLFQHLQKRGIRVYLWVLNDEKDFDRAFYEGADGIMTDYPSRLTQYLVSRDIKSVPTRTK